MSIIVCVIFNDISTILLKEMECIFQKLLKPLTFTHLGYTNPRSLSSSHGNISLKSCFIFRMSFLYINSINFLVLYGIMFYVKKCMKNLKFALVGITYRAQMLYFLYKWKYVDKPMCENLRNNSSSVSKKFVNPFNVIMQYTKIK